MFLKLKAFNTLFWMSDWRLNLRRLKPEEKVNMAVGMTDACVSVCAEGIKAQHPGISKEELLEKLRERIEYAKRLRQRWRREV